MDDSRVDILVILLMKFMKDYDISLADMARLLAVVSNQMKGK